MSLLNIRYDGQDKELTNVINAIISTVNSLSDDNLRASASIDPAKIAFDFAIDTHGGRHSATGVDPLPARSINTANLIERCVTSPIIAIASILPEHLASGLLAASIFIDDTIQSASHGATIDVVTGYTKTIIIPMGFECSTDGNHHLEEFKSYLTSLPGGGWQVVCQMKDDEGSLTNGSIKYVRMALK